MWSVLGIRRCRMQEHAEFLNRLADESGAVFDTAGSLRGGRAVFVTMRLPETMRVGGADSEREGGCSGCA